MVSKENVGRAFGVCLATMGAIVTTMVVRSFLQMTTWLTLSIFVVLWIVMYFTGLWTFLYRPAELNKKFPITSEELRRRKKEFYDWLASQGRR